MSSMIVMQRINSQKINDWVTYVLVALLFAPHATKECVEVCNGPVFVSFALQGFLTPFVEMDMSAHGFLMQLLWSPVFIIAMFFIFKLRDNIRFGKIFQIYLVRWVLYFIIIVILYNLLFWGGVRPYVFPAFIF